MIAARGAVLSGRRCGVRALLVVAAAASLFGPLPSPASAATALTGVDLSTYVRIGRFDLPEPTRTTPPANSVLAQEASAVTYDWDTETLFVVGDGSTSVVQVDKTGRLIDSMTLAPGSSPQGTDFYDTEGIAYVGQGKFVLVEERYRQVSLFTYVPNTTLTKADVKSATLGTTIGNLGIEGITTDPQTGGFIAVKESQPLGIFQTAIDFVAGTATNGSPTTEHSADLFNPPLAGLADFSDVFALANLSTLTGPDTSHLLVLSQESGKIVNVDRAGNVSSSLTIFADPGNPLSVADQTHEGIAMDDDGRLYVVSENGGGDVNHPQLWVYAPSAVANQPPTAVTLTNKVGAIAENTATATRLKVADVTVADDGLGTNNLSVTGADAGSFEVDASGLYIKAGTVLDHETKTSYSVTVAVDDPTVGGSPDATSALLTVAVTDVADEGGPTPPLVISEVSPWSSGNSPYAADWFEVTNTGTTAVDLTGYKMDDSSNAFANAVALDGVGSIAPGQSAIFVEGDASKASAFAAAWFGTSVPIGFAIGTYGGGGVGLSTGGDAINLFNHQGARVTGVGFGASTTNFTFDNAAGVGSRTLPLPTISTLSVAGRNGAFLAGQETGSPGTIVADAIVSEVSPWSSGNSPYAADWFEVTNTGTHAIDLTGWTMDDNSHAFANAVALIGVSSVAPGQSVIFIEGDASKASAFTTAWFGAHVPSGFALGTYGGAGVGLSTGGDAVNLFDALGNRVTGVGFDASTTYFTFDNAAGQGSRTLPLPTLSTLSVVGRNGAYRAGQETGSPATIKPDTTAPTVTYRGTAGTYTVDQQVSITCTATDEPQGSGIASTTCANVRGSAEGFGLGTRTFSATARDRAGNVGRGSVRFTVRVTPRSLCILTKRFAHGSARYRNLSAKPKAAFDKQLDRLCTTLLDPIKPGITPRRKQHLIGEYKGKIDDLADDRWLTRAQATKLSRFASGL